MLFTSIADNIIQAIWAMVRLLFMFICEYLYRFIIFTYDIFTRIACAEVLSDTAIMAIYQRVGLVLGIFMVFRLSFSFIQIIINPDTISDSEKGMANIVKKAIFVVVLLGFVPYIFDAAFEIQKAVLKDGVINRIILGQTTNSGDVGADLAYNLFIGTYKVSEDPAAVSEDYEDDWGYDYDYDDCVMVVTGNKPDHSDSKLLNEMSTYHEMSHAYDCLNYMYDSTGQNSDASDNAFLINFSYLYTLIIGALVAYLLALYCVKASIRVVQLAFLQLIAPVPIMSYLSPKKDGMFDKWVKMCVTTFIDIFIRTAIIALTAELSLIILQDDTGNVLWNTTDQPTGLTWFFIQVLLVIGLFMFAKKAPELLKELFPSSGAASLGGMFQSPKKAWDEMKAPFSSVASAGKAIGRVAGAPGRAMRRVGDIHDEGGTVRGAMRAGLQKRLGRPTAADRQDREMKRMQSSIDAFDTAKKEAQSEVDKNENKYMGRIKDHTGNSKVFTLGTLRQMANDQTLTAMQRSYYSDRYNDLRKKASEHAMAHGGAVDSGHVSFDTINGTVDDTGVRSYDSNATITANMNAAARGTDTNPEDFKAVKAVINEYNDTNINIKSSAEYQRNVANRDNSIGGNNNNKK